MNKVILKNGKLLLFNELIKLVPASSFISNDHIEHCNYFANKKYEILSDDFKIYVNLLTKKSVKVRQFTALVFLINNHILDVSAIETDFFDSAAKKFFKHNFIIDTDNISTDLVDKKHLKVFSLKVIVHNLFRLISFPKKNFTSGVRSFVEVSEKLYKNEFKDSNILIYPFPLNTKRQITFIRHCFNVYPKQVTLTGLPYNLRYILHLLLKSTSKDEVVVEAEKNAYTKHAKELIKLGFKEFFTTDDFEVAAFILHQNLSENGIYTLNKAHGVSQSCPYVHYDEFCLLTTKQYEFYTQWNKDIKYTYQSILENTEKSTLTESDFNVKLVFMHSNLEQCNLMYEANLQIAIINLLQEISKKLNIDLIVKLHPNTPNSDIDIINKLGVTPAHDINFKEIDPLFITMFSTSFYTYIKEGPFIFIGDNLLNPNEYFGEDLPIYSYENKDDIENNIAKYTKLINYSRLHDHQITQLERTNAEH